MKYLTFVDSINTFNLKNHQVLKLKFLSTKQWQWIYSRGGPTGPPLGLIRLTTFSIYCKKWKKGKKCYTVQNMKGDVDGNLMLLSVVTDVHS